MFTYHKLINTINSFNCVADLQPGARRRRLVRVPGPALRLRETDPAPTHGPLSEQNIYKLMDVKHLIRARI